MVRWVRSFDIWVIYYIHGRTMALKLLNLQIIFEKQLIRQTPLLTISRFGHRLRGKAPGVARTLEQRLNGKFFFVNNHFFLVMYLFRNGIVFQMKEMLIRRLTKKSTLVSHGWVLDQNRRSARNVCHT